MKVTAPLVLLGQLIRKAVAVDPTHLFTFENGLEDSLNSMLLLEKIEDFNTGDVGSVSGGAYQFGFAQGLRLLTPEIPSEDYTVEMCLSFLSETGFEGDSYQALVEFQNSTEENAFAYNDDDDVPGMELSLWGLPSIPGNVRFSSEGVFLPCLTSQFFVTRNQTDRVVKGYIGTEVIGGLDRDYEYNITQDSSGNSIIYFVVDSDEGEEDGEGFINYIRLWNRSLTQEEIYSLSLPTGETCDLVVGATTRRKLGKAAKCSTTASTTKSKAPKAPKTKAPKAPKGRRGLRKDEDKTDESHASPYQKKKN